MNFETLIRELHAAEEHALAVQNAATVLQQRELAVLERETQVVGRERVVASSSSRRVKR